jgi:chemotaxis methyl-accepting protein methylase/chemotaxis response regulator CheB
LHSPIILLTQNKDFGVKLYNYLQGYDENVEATLFLDICRGSKALESKFDLAIIDEKVEKSCSFINTGNDHGCTLIVSDDILNSQETEKHNELKNHLNLYFGKDEDKLNGERVKSPDILGIGASTGGPAALLDLFSSLRSDLPFPIVIVNHIPPGHFAKNLADSLCYNSKIKVFTAQTGMIMKNGQAYLCPGGKHMIVKKIKGKKQYYPVLTDDAPVNSCKPSIDKMFESLSSLKFTDVAAAILTGMGEDGTKGALSIRDNKGCVYAQNPAECLIKSMPTSLILSGGCSKVLTLNELAYHINKGLFSFSLKKKPDKEITCSDSQINLSKDKTKIKVKTTTQIDEKLLECFKNLLQNEAANTGYSETVFTLKRKLETLLKKFKFQSYHELYNNAIKRTLVRQAVIDTLTNHETFFLRDQYPFDFLQNVFIPDSLKIGRTTSIWSAACSTGQEPYSISMILNQIAEEKASLFSVTATDISKLSLEKAKRGEFSKSDIKRGLPDKFKKYLLNNGETIKVCQKIRKLIRFKAINLLKIPPDFPSFDLIFLRYVLIYFDDETKKQVLNSIINHLKTGGYLILDPATALKVKDKRVTSARYHSQTIFIKKGDRK